MCMHADGQRLPSGESLNWWNVGEGHVPAGRRVQAGWVECAEYRALCTQLGTLRDGVGHAIDKLDGVGCLLLFTAY